jgi:Holliday junction resolvase
VTGRGSQRKGSRAERELASVLTDLLGVECRKGSSPFLPGIIAPDVHVAGNIHIEVKRRERFSLPAALSQSEADAGAGQVPVVCHRPNRHDWMMTVRLSALPKLAAAIMSIIEGRATHE